MTGGINESISALIAVPNETWIQWRGSTSQ